MTTKHSIAGPDFQGKKKTTSKTLHDIRSNKKTAKITNLQKKSSSNNWLSRHINDPFVQASRQEGYVSRAAYKLIELEDRYNLFKPGNTVIDLGCAPGSWLQVVWDKIKSKNSLLIGVDLLPANIESTPEILKNLDNNIHLIEGDFTSPEVRMKVVSKMGEKMADCIISDIAPNATGIKAVDHMKSAEIVELVNDFAINNLNPSGNFVTKIFDGSETKEVIQTLKRTFKTVTVHKPIASRSGSSEVYLVALNKKP